MQRRTLLATLIGMMAPALAARQPLAGQEKSKDPRYPSLGPGHFIKENRENGRFIVIEDKSVWEVPAADRYRTAEWGELEGIALRFAEGDPPYDYEMTNLDRDEGVAAHWVRPQ